MKNLIIITGPPASGKTLLAQTISELFEPSEIFKYKPFLTVPSIKRACRNNSKYKLMIIDECSIIELATVIEKSHLIPLKIICVVSLEVLKKYSPIPIELNMFELKRF